MNTNQFLVAIHFDSTRTHAQLEALHKHGIPKLKHAHQPAFKIICHVEATTCSRKVASGHDTQRWIGSFFVRNLSKGSLAGACGIREAPILGQFLEPRSEADRTYSPA